jgi:hypothetical protein
VIIDGAAADKVASISTKSGYEDYTEYTIIKHFSVSTRAWYLLCGLVPTDRPDIGEIVAKQSAGGDGVINLRVVTEYDVVDFLVDLFLGYVTITSRKVKIEGDVIKVKKSSKEGK